MLFTRVINPLFPLTPVVISTLYQHPFSFLPIGIVVVPLQSLVVQPSLPSPDNALINHGFADPECAWQGRCQCDRVRTYLADRARSQGPPRLPHLAGVGEQQATNLSTCTSKNTCKIETYISTFTHPSPREMTPVVLIGSQAQRVDGFVSSVWCVYRLVVSDESLCHCRGLKKCTRPEGLAADRSQTGSAPCLSRLPAPRYRL